MKDFISLLVDPALLGMNVFIVLGAVMICFMQAHDNSTNKLVRIAWPIALAILAIWIFQQEHHVCLGSLIPTATHPVAVAFKGTTRYVSEAQAFLYNSGMWLLLGVGLCFLGLNYVASRKRHEA